MSADPLHVQVARALNWDNLHERTGGHWWGREPHGGLTITVPRYDTSWCSVGPLVQRFDIDIMRRSTSWEATNGGDAFAISDTPQSAIARLIVELAKQEKLPK